MMRSTRGRLLVVSASIGVALGACSNDGGGGGLIDRGVCDVLIECAGMLSPGSEASFEQVYGPAGSCWQSGPGSWAACRDFCATTLEQLNTAAMLTGGATCGTCTSDSDCAAFGAGATCDAGVCLPGADEGVAEAGDGDGDGGDGDGDPVVPSTAVSILLVVDNSASMGEEQSILAGQAWQLTNELETAGIPWRLGITTTDNGNPWCPAGTTTPEGGKLVLSPCTARLGDFLVNGGQVDVQDLACNNVCNPGLEVLPSTTAQDPTPTVHPWIESNGAGQTNIADNDVGNALGCFIPQGINGCGFESTIQAGSLAIARAASADEESFGFVEPGRLLVVIYVTDEEDCSYSPGWSAIFEASGGKTFWSDPDADFPTSAVCWNAGVNCVGDPSGYDSCDPVDKAIDGSVTTDPDAAVLRPIDGLIAAYQANGPVLAFGILGVDSNGDASYADVSGTDPDFQNAFGIGPGCSVPNIDNPSEPIQAVPPVRLRAMFEALGPTDGRAAYSICDSNFDSALYEIGATIVAAF